MWGGSNSNRRPRLISGNPNRGPFRSLFLQVASLRPSAFMELRRRHIVLITQAAAVCLCVVLFASGWSYLNTREVRMKRAIGLRSVMLAISMYESNHGEFPADINDGNTLLSSWRYRLVPYITATTQRAVWPDKAWDAPENSEWRKRDLNAYCREGDTRCFVFMNHPKDVIDPKTGHPTLLCDRPKELIVLFTAESNIHWMEPADTDLPQSLHTHGSRADFYVAFADNAVWLLRKDTPPSLLLPCLQGRTANHNAREALRPFAIWTDTH